jgi:predicted alpha/beta superfamily hydrolase
MLGMWTEQGPLAIDGTSVFDLDSPTLVDKLRITVATPAFYAALQSPMAAIYVLDGNICLPMASSIARTMELQSMGSCAPVICVGIGYPTDNVLDVMSLRTRDMTPVPSEMPETPMRIDRFGMGGASKFLDSLINEVFPFVEERFRADPAQRGIAGWSLGGLFVLHALFSGRNPFDKAIAISPSIWWADREMVTEEEKYAASHDDLACTLYATVGDREETAPSRTWPRVPAEYADQQAKAEMVSNLSRLVETLRTRRYPSLVLHHEVLPEHHSSIFPAGFTRGLLQLYSNDVY